MRLRLMAILGMTSVLALVFAPAALARPATPPPPAHGHYSRIAVPGAASTTPEGIADNGEIVGCFDRRTGPGRGFIDRGGVFTTIADPAAGSHSGDLACAQGVNEKGAIVGFFVRSSGRTRGFVYRSGGFTTIVVPTAAAHGPVTATAAIGINDSGVIVGWYFDGKNVEHGFMLRNGTYTTINDPLAGTAALQGTSVVAIADNGMIAGTYTDRKGHHHGFLYHDGVFRRFDVPRELNTLVACVASKGGLVVGEYYATTKSPAVGFSHRGSEFRSLHYPGAARGSGQGTEPQCGNDRGRIVGIYIDRSGRQQGFSFTPA